MNFSVVIPSRNPDNLKACLDSIFENEPLLRQKPKRICVVDDGRPGAMKLTGNWPKIRWARGDDPFVFSSNVNIGIGRSDYRWPVILLNDDTRLLTRWGFSELAATSLEHPNYGVISAAITDAVGNLEQMPTNSGTLRPTDKTVCFVAVLLSYDCLYGHCNGDVGRLDERFADYGFDDDDYCLRVRRAGMKVGISDRCIVEHGKLPSSYRGFGHRSLEENRRRFNEKWEGIAKA